MRIERFQIQGFKSIANSTVENLSDINVFYGLNDVGKSNIFEALALWHWLFTTERQVNKNDGKMIFSISLQVLETEFGPSLFRLGGNECIQISVDLDIDKTRAARATGNKRITIELEVKRMYDEIQCHIQGMMNPSRQRILPKNLRSILPTLSIINTTLRIITADRRLQNEKRSEKRQIAYVSDFNLKQALFYAYLSSDLEQKQRLTAIKQVLAAPSFDLGELDIALDPTTDEIDIGFVRAEGRLPIENLGAGPQQLLLILGQIFLNDCPIIALEEPEMNLSPQYQEQLMLALRQLMADPAVKLEQLFISTHSPYFEFTENFYDVTLDGEGATQVKRSTSTKHAQHFSMTQIGPSEGARLNSLNQVELYERVIEDLKLQRGDLVLFIQNEQGHWEIQPAQKVAQELQTLSNGSFAQ